MKFRVERDVLADAVAWAARSLPVRPSVPVLAGLLDRGQRRRPGALDLRLRDLRPRHAHRPRSPTRAGPWSAAGCSPTSAAACPAKPVEMVLDGARVSLTCGSARFSLQTMPVEDYPTLPDMPAATGTVPSDVFAHAVAQAVTAAGRDDMLPVLTGVRHRDRRLDDLAAGHRPVPALATASSSWNPRTPDESAGRAGAGQGARRHRQVAHRRHRGHHRARRPPASGEGIIGFEGAAAGGVRRTTTRLLDGEFPKVRSLFPSEHQTVAAGRQGRAHRVGQARRAGRRAQHRGPAGLQRRRADPRRRLRRRGPGLGVDRGRRSRARTSPPASTRSSCSTA